MNSKEVNLNEVSELIRTTLQEMGATEFKPVAYFDEPLDCLRVVVRNCSMTEVRINELLTLLEANYPQNNEPAEYVGFNVKGLRHLCNMYGLGTDGHIQITQVLNQIVANSPQTLVKLAVGVAFRLTDKLETRTFQVTTT